MQIFIAWSGAASERVAKALKDWLPLVNSSIDPFISTSMDAGARWRTEIGNRLKDTSFGLVCVTRDNLDSRWLNFEAGAIGKALDEAHVIPLLYQIGEAEVSGPLAQFQMKRVDKEGIRDTLETINKYAANSHAAERFERVFNTWWPQLEADVRRIDEEVAATSNAHAEVAPRPEDLLAEVLTTTRAISRQLNQSPVALPGNNARRAVLGDTAPRRFLGGRFRLPRGPKAAIIEIIELLPDGRVDGWDYLDHELTLQLSMDRLTPEEDQTIREVCQRHNVDLMGIHWGDP
jgi:hypothetical protein